MFAWWARMIIRARWAVLVIAAMIVVIGATWGVGVFDALTDGGFQNEDSPSSQTSERIDEKFGRQTTDIVVLYESDQYVVTDPQFADDVSHKAAEIEKWDEVDTVASYYSTKSETFVADDEHSTFVAVTLTGDDDAERADQYASVKDDLAIDGFQTQLGGEAAIFDDVNTQTQQDIITAEMYSLPILLGLMVIIFGSLVAATTPLLVGLLAIMGGFIVTRVLTTVTDISVFAINVITIIGLGLAIDYALFVVNRFREELDNGHHPHTAVERTMSTAGRTVMVSGLTIILSLAGLLMFPLPFLHGIAYGGMSAVAVAILGSLTVLPALAAILGPKLDAVRMPWRRKTRSSSKRHGAWSAIGRSVMRRPILYMLGVIALLALAASPFLHANFGTVDEKVLPEGTDSRVVSERIEAEFPGGDLGTLDVLVENADEEQIAEVSGDITDLDHVDSVSPVATEGEDTVLQVSFDADDQSPQARELVAQIRDLSAPSGVGIGVTGMPADLEDMFDDLAEYLPWLALYVAGVTLVLLFFAFGSILLPLKAIAMNVVSIGASFGAVVWIFQDGHFADFLNFTPTSLEPTILILMLVILFGLSTDYEVFLLSRVREEWDRTGDNTAAVLAGLQRTGGIITSAALLLIVVVGAFAAGGIVVIKMVGIGMAVAIFVDASLVRMLLVPATMRILGNANWWAPKPLRRFYASYGLKEEISEETEPQSQLEGHRS